MPSELRVLTQDPDALAWLCTRILINYASASWHMGDTAYARAEDGNTREAAAQIHHDSATPLQKALWTR